MATLNLRAYKPTWGTLSLESRLSGHMFDDDANAFYFMDTSGWTRMRRMISVGGSKCLARERICSIAR